MLAQISQHLRGETLLSPSGLSAGEYSKTSTWPNRPLMPANAAARDGPVHDIGSKTGSIYVRFPQFGSKSVHILLSTRDESHREAVAAKHGSD